MLIPTAFAQATIKISSAIPGLNSNGADAAPGAFIANFYQFALLIGGILAFGAIVYGGVKSAISAGNPSALSEARSWIWSALLGLLLLGGAYIILNTINPALINLNLQTLSPLSISASSGGTGGTGGGGGAGCSGAGGGSGIAAAAAAYCGANTSGGPSSGVLACAWAVNNVLTNAGIAPLDSDSVQAMENALTAGRGTLVTQSQAMAGDIVIQAQDGHVGICLNNGCTQVISNSSSNRSFTWVSDTSFSPSYSGGPGRIYHVNN